MPAFKTESNKTWYVMVRYIDWKGERKQKCKRGFPTRAKALEWEREFLQQVRSDVDMTFESFFELYAKDIKPRLNSSCRRQSERTTMRYWMWLVETSRISDFTFYLIGSAVCGCLLRKKLSYGKNRQTLCWRQ